MNKISTYALYTCYLIMVFSAFIFFPKWTKGKTEATLSWDVSGYYMYLPALFIYNDITHCSFKDSILKKYSPTPDFQQAFIHQPSGHYVMKYASGQAITMLPWFAIAHTWAKVSNVYVADGFSFPYQFCIGFGMLLYAFIGLFYLRKILLLFFKDSTVALVLLLYIIGTNYLDYASIDQAMPHSNLFVIYVFIIWNTIRYYQHPSLQRVLIVGLLCGLATLIRPTELIAVLIPLMWNVGNWSDFKIRFSFIIANRTHIVWFAVMVVLVVSIQPIYWKLVTSDWIVYSYQDQGFSWSLIHLKDYTLSYRCGWLRYSPMMLLPFVGLIPFLLKESYARFICFFILLSLYIVSAWDVWDYGGTAGRAMVQYYPFMAFPFAALIEKVNNKLWYKIVFYPIVLLCVYLNVWWTYNAHSGHVQVSEISKEYYWKMVGRWHASESDKKLLDNTTSFDGIPKNSVSIYSNDFFSDTSQNKYLVDGRQVIRLNKELQNTVAYEITKPEKVKKWIRVTGKFTCKAKEWKVWNQAQFIVSFLDKGQTVQTNFIRIYRFLDDGDTKEIYLDAIAPPNWDKATIQCWNADSEKELYIENIHAQMFDE